MQLKIISMPSDTYGYLRDAALFLVYLTKYVENINPITKKAIPVVASTGWAQISLTINTNIGTTNNTASRTSKHPKVC